jgi:cytochrome c
VRLLPLLAAAAALLLAASPAMRVAAAAEEEGARAFEQRCASCHAAEAQAPPGAGPNLAGLAGRRIGGDPGFDFSPVLAAADGEWDAARLDRFLEDPEEMFPGLWMGGNGVREPSARAAIVRFLLRPQP